MQETPDTIHPFADDVVVRGPASEQRRAAMATALQDAGRVVLTSHRNVDADGLGSALGLQRALRFLGKEAVVAVSTPPPANLDFLPGSADVLVVADGADIPASVAAADTVVALDCGNLARLGRLGDAGRAAATFLNIDHHVSNEGFGTATWVDPGYAATGLMAFELVCELGATLDRETCLPLYVALVTDTGGFAFSNTDPRTHRMAATCLARGVTAEEVTLALHRRRSLGSFRFEAEAIERLRTSPDHLVAWSTVTGDMITRHGVDPAAPPDVVQVPTMLADTRVAFLLTEVEDGIKVSLRSRCPVGVHKVAAALGGGGHPRAAGCTRPGDLAGVEAEVLAAIAAAFDDWREWSGKDGPPPQDA